MTVLREKYASKTVLANKVYQDYINFRDHVHMNATKWDSLGSFCKVICIDIKISLIDKSFLKRWDEMRWGGRMGMYKVNK